MALWLSNQLSHPRAEYPLLCVRVAALHAPVRRWRMSQTEREPNSDTRSNDITATTSSQSRKASSPMSNDIDDKPDTPQSTRQYSQLTRLREETEAPFRKARMFVYAGSAASAAVGLFISGLRVIAALSGVSGVQPLKETIPNVGINLSVIALFVFLLRLENKAGVRRLERMSRGAQIANLRIEDSVTRTITPLKQLRGKTRIALVAGGVEKVSQVMKEAEKLRDEISKSNMLIVPYISDDVERVPGRSWRMQPYGKDDWNRWLSTERDAAKKRLKDSDDVFVVIIRLDGKVGARSVGPPLWSRLVEEVSRLPTKDQHGRP
ncbi:Low psii accumulation 1 protein [Gracilaria domingensis]|nr:Low psii accumulation 1 protein [Gracilaria domingensis]